MNDFEKTKDELIIELNELKSAYNLLTQKYQEDIVTTKKAEPVFIDSEEKYQVLFDNAPLGYQSLDFEGNFIFVNQRWLDTLGYTRDEVVGKWFGDFLTPAFRDGFRQRFPLFKERGRIHSEFEMVHKNGNILFIAFDGKIAHDSTGDFLQTHCILQDITEQRKSEQIIKKEKIFSDKLIESLPGIFYMFDSNFTPLRWNLNKTKLLGLTEEEMKTHNTLDFIADRDKEKVVESFQKTFIHGESSAIVNINTGEGEELTYHLTGKRLDTDDGSFLLGIGIDITEQKRAEEMLQNIIDKNPLAIQILNIDGYAIQTNSAHTELFGAIIPANYSIFKDEILLQQGFGELFERVKQGEVVSFPDSTFNVHDVDPSFPDKSVAVKTIGFSLNDNSGKPEKIILIQENITERNKTDNMLKGIIEKNPMSIQIVDKNGCNIQVNPTFNKIFGSAPPANFSIFDDLSKKSPELEKLMKSVKNGEVVSLPDIYYNPHDFSTDYPDNPVWIRALIFPLLDNKGNPEQFVLMHENVTERKQAEKDLLERELNYLGLFDTVKHAIYIQDTDLTFINVNHGAVEMYGYDREFFIGKTPEVLSAPGKNDLNHIVELVTKAFNGEPQKYEFWGLRKDGSIFPKDVWTIKGKYFGKDVLFTLANDITERKQAEERLIESEVQYRNLANAGLALIWTSNTNKLCDYFNTTWLDFTGRTLEQEMGYGWAEGVHPEDLDRCVNIYVSAFDKREKFNMEYRLMHVSGEYRWISDLGTPNYNSSGEFIGYIGHCFDITNSKKAEQQLKRQNQELESQYEEYMQLNEVLSVTNCDLELAKIKAEESDRLKTAFLQNMSHEIRTPLNGIIGFSSLLQDEDISLSEVSEYSRIIQQSGKRLIEIVNNVLDISKIETGQMEIKCTTFSVNSVLADLYSFFVPFANSTGIKLNYTAIAEYGESLIFTDENKLNQILTNLINNALKFTTKGSIDFGCEIIGEQILFYVKDTGCGIGEDYQDKVFERFVQAEVSLSRGYEGAGLGLAICKGLVELLGGKIWLTTTLNQGTEFFFTLPFTRKSLINNEPINEVTLIDNNKKIKILIAEDDFTSYQYLTKVLKNLNTEILLAENGLKAVEAVKSIPDIDLILMDIKMPVMDGMQATIEIKKIRPEVPIIAQTAYAFSEEKEKFLFAGCNDYIAKPIPKEILLSLIEKYLK